MLVKKWIQAGTKLGQEKIEHLMLHSVNHNILFESVDIDFLF